jgi:hypothetical protein
VGEGRDVHGVARGLATPPQPDVAAEPDDAVGFDVEDLHADAAVEDRTHRADAGFERLDAEAGGPNAPRGS